MNPEELKRYEAERLQTKAHYQAIKDQPGIEDLLVWLKDMATQERRKAGAHLDDAYKRSLYLQNSLVYEKVTSHLLDMFKDDVNPTIK